MKKLVISVGMVTGLLVLGACSSHPGSKGKLKAQMINGGGNVSGTGKRVCIRKTKTGSHLNNYYCMTAAQYKQYQKDQEVEQEKWHKRLLQHDGTTGGSGGGF